MGQKFHICHFVCLFTPLTFTKLLPVQWYFPDMFHTTFHQKQSRNMESMGTKSFMSLSEVWMSLNEFSRNCVCSTTFWKEPPIMNFTEIQKTTQLLIPGHWCQTDMASVWCTFFHFIKNAWKCNYHKTVIHKAAVPYNWHVRLAETEHNQFTPVVRTADVVSSWTNEGPFFTAHAAQLANPTSAKRKGINVGKTQVQWNVLMVTQHTYDNVAYLW